MYEDDLEDEDDVEADDNDIEAVAHFEKGMEIMSIAPNLTRADLSQACNEFTEVIRLSSSSSLRSLACNNCGIIYAMEGNLSAAIKLWEEALEIDPNNPKARENIEKARRERGY